MRGRWPCTAFGRRRGATRAAKRNGGGGEEAGTRKGARTAAATWTGACYPTSPWNSSEFRMSWRRVAYSNSARPCMRNRSRMPPPGTQDTSAYCPGLHRPPPLRTAHPRDRGGRTASCPAILRPPRAFPVRPMRGRCPAAPPRHTRSRGACQNTRGPPRTPPHARRQAGSVLPNSVRGLDSAARSSGTPCGLVGVRAVHGADRDRLVEVCRTVVRHQPAPTTKRTRV